jgi:outer membrane protein assembly factor BamE (lipoprotein component of BamABCDE complex)
MFNLRRAVFWVVLLQLAGCAATGRPDVTSVDIGMTQGQVVSILGEPLTRETYGGTEFLFYENNAGTRIPIAIVAGRVTSIGRAAYEVVVRSKSQANTADRR